MLNVAIGGSNGRMGKSLVQAAMDEPKISIGAASVTENCPSLGEDVGLISGVGPLHVVTVDDFEQVMDDFDLMFDFTGTEATIMHLDLCSRYGKKMVIGTTGFTLEEKQHIKEISEKIAIVFAPNMSVGVNVLFKLIEQATAVLGDSSDIEIIEAHHRHKVDAPSGTALHMGEVAAGVLGRNLSDVAVYGREGLVGERQDKTIGFETIRAGDIIGDHTIMFASPGERIEITHRSSSRMNYAAGAIRAALWLQDKENGLYNMQDVLGL
ncbi:4-hydroxy-tetrahydrodipicolinate reductase [Gammaproteobacteria bacterium]|jgi:4-hydroxy-tetrahydrodipicolinate reductase|nr:4-hydroxy-tetrahydrodipicolinate reductase [Gammaproteobacteria bacterium]